MFDNVNFENSISNLPVVTADYVKKFFTPLGKTINKGSLGRLVLVGGSKNYVGAVLLASEAAMRVGLGTSMLACPKSICSDLRSRVLYSGLFPLSEVDGNIKFVKEEFAELSNGATAFAVGMGGANGEFENCVDYIFENTSLNFVLDADGLKSIGQNAKRYGYRAVFTPHPKEMSKLCGYSVEDILNSPVEIAKEYAKSHEIILLLKGYKTIITDGERVMLNVSGSPKMAKGGSGDVLSGVIGALLARGVLPFDAACAGAFICGKAAENSSINEYSFLPTDTINEIVKVVDFLTKAE